MNSDMRENLYELKEIKRHMDSYYEIGREYIRQQEIFERYKKAEERWAPKNKVKYVVLTAAAGVIIVPLFFVGVPAAVGLYFFYDKISEEKKRLREKKEEELTDLLRRYCQYRDPVSESCERLLFDRDDYEVPMSVDYLIQLIETGRVDTMREAYDRLDEQLHRWTMENMQKQQLEVQMYQAKKLQEIASIEAARLGEAFISRVI